MGLKPIGNLTGRELASLDRGRAPRLGALQAGLNRSRIGVRKKHHLCPWEGAAMGSVDVNSLHRLRYVKTEGIRRRDLRYFPDFLILGPQRTGTTWLAKILRRHPQIFMSFPKELYFFNLLGKPEHRFYRSDELRWYLRRFRDNPATIATKMSLALWKHRELYHPIVRGEATASYAAMNPELITEVVALNPLVKGIVTIRDPVTRAWSHAKKDLVRSRKRRVEDVSHEEFAAFFLDPYQLACGNYQAILRNWTQALKPGNLFVGQFDEIGADPASYLRKLLGFLGVSSDLKYVLEYMHGRVNTTEDSDIPGRYRDLLRSSFAGQMGTLDETGNWTLPARDQQTAGAYHVTECAGP